MLVVSPSNGTWLSVFLRRYRRRRFCAQCDHLLRCRKCLCVWPCDLDLLEVLREVLVVLCYHLLCCNLRTFLYRQWLGGKIITVIVIVTVIVLITVIVIVTVIVVVITTISSNFITIISQS